jgi:hypothetical protein
MHLLGTTHIRSTPFAAGVINGKPPGSKSIVIVLHWRNWGDTDECLKSILRMSNDGFDVLLIDNGSEDNCMEKCQRDYNGRVKVIRSDINRGFAGGNNLGIRHALENGYDYILLLNNDTKADPRLLAHLEEGMMRDPVIGIAAPEILYYGFQNRVWWNGEKARVRRPRIRNTEDLQIIEVRDAPGAALLVRSRVFEEVGLFDEDYKYYCEDRDFCARTSRRGYALVCVRNARLWHKVSASTGGEMNPTMLYSIMRNDFMFAKKNLSSFRHIPALVRTFLIDIPLLTISASRFKKRKSRIASILKGLRDGWIWALS